MRYRKSICALFLVLAMLLSGNAYVVTASASANGKAADGNKAAFLNEIGLPDEGNDEDDQNLDIISGFYPITYTTSSVQLEWYSLGNSTGYHIYRKCKFDSAYKKVGSVENTFGQMWFTDKTFKRGITYKYKLVSYRIDENGEEKEGISSICTAECKLPAVSIKAVGRSGNNAIVKWKTVKNVAGYEIYKKVSGGKRVKVKTVGKTATKASVSNVSRTKTTAFYVRAYVTYGKNKVMGAFSTAKCLYNLSTQKIVAKIKQLQKKFPSGKYWNHVGKKKYDSSTVTNKPCSHWGNQLSTCNCYVCPNGVYGYQCYGFAWKMSDLVYGKTAKIKNFRSFDKCRMGDVIRYSGHSVFVTEKHKDYIVVGECNYGNTCMILWGRRIYRNELKGALYSSRYR